MKTFDPRNIFTPFTVEFAKKYEGKSGYFSDSFNPDLTQWIKGFMLISPSKHKPYNCAEPTTTHYTFYTFFIPDELVQEIKDKKKYRPFKNCNELCQHIHVTGEDLYTGLTINIRNKENKIVRQVLVTDINYGKPFIALGISLFDLENLYRSYEWQDDEDWDWHPFGVEE